ncbi:MAG TPA: response regulator [Pyrinomonadaceae bacterium]|jgi:DNA-binding response OmpR family regulator|nr:response regulator [Pyrinomonadaceae bacterium]
MSRRLLIVDDEENIRRVTRLTLQAAGYEVGEAADGERGLEAFGDGSIWDAVLLDQRMPGLDGLETLRRINERDPSARVIMATAYASIELAVEAMKLGATDFVRKPMTPEILRNAVAAALAKEPRAREKVSATKKEATEKPLVQIITMNGFTILDSQNGRQDPNERRFLVKSPTGSEHEVLVEIDDEAVGYVERMTRKRLPAENSFWTGQAERILSDYLWQEGKIPPTRKLTIKDIDRDDLPLAARWQSN